MDVAQRLIAWYQTASPKKLAEYLNIEVCYKQLPNRVYGIYVPQGSSATIVVNRQLAELRQQFLLCYDIRKHLKDASNFIITEPKRASDYELCGAYFAFNILVENGDIESNAKSFVGSFVDAGTPQHIAFGVYDAVAKAKFQHRPLTSI